MNKLQRIAPELNKEDYRGNRISFDPDTGMVTLSLVGDSPRNIGGLAELNGGITYIKSEDEQYIHRNTFGWSINVEVAEHCDIIRFVTPDTTYTITKSDAKAKRVLQREPDRPSLDRKWYVPIRHWNIASTNHRKNILIERMGFEWYHLLKDEFSKPYMEKLNTILSELKVEVCPPDELYFNAFRQTPFSQVKVVILGQDPYHTPGVAHGLAFSSAMPEYVPPSLQNIFRECETDIHTGLILFQDPDLTRWASQGVLLLNTILTVEAHKPASHQNLGWEEFTSQAIRQINDRLDGVVFLLWGAHAQRYEQMISSKHFVFTAPHPSPLSAHRGFLGCKHFSKTNAVLAKLKKAPIDW